MSCITACFSLILVSTSCCALFKLKNTELELFVLVIFRVVNFALSDINFVLEFVSINSKIKVTFQLLSFLLTSHSTRFVISSWIESRSTFVQMRSSLQFGSGCCWFALCRLSQYLGGESGGCCWSPSRWTLWMPLSLLDRLQSYQTPYITCCIRRSSNYI